MWGLTYFGSGPCRKPSEKHLARKKTSTSSLGFLPARLAIRRLLLQGLSYLQASCQRLSENGTLPSFAVMPGGSTPWY